MVPSSKLYIKYSGNAPKPHGNFTTNQWNLDHGPFLTTAVWSVLDESGINYVEMECAGDEFDLDNEDFNLDDEFDLDEKGRLTE